MLRSLNGSLVHTSRNALSGVGMNKAQKGFSLLELVTVVAIILIVTAMAVPAVRQTISSYQLDASGHAVASMLQQVRSAAVQNNTPYYTQYDGAAGPGIAFAVPAVRYADTFAYQASIDPTVAVASNVVFLPAAGTPPTYTGLETAMGMAAGTAQINGVIAFNARGLPCSLAATGNKWRCLNTANSGFVWFLQNNLTQQWAAITVSPAGRMKTWRMTSPGVWQ
jgi:prepilin-type N-terminal cleavage/methylation domain-containing protein